MKKTLLAAAVISAFSLVNAAHAANNGTITFTGKLTDQTCSVVLNGGSSASGTVALQTLQVSKIATAGGTAGKTYFTLNLSGCKSVTTAFGVTAYFPNNATYVSSYYGLLNNQQTGATAATYVGLELLQVNGATETVVPLGKDITDTGYKYTTVAANTTSATLNYAVQYKNPWSTATTAGLVKGIAIYELAYN